MEEAIRELSEQATGGLTKIVAALKLGNGLTSLLTSLIVFLLCVVCIRILTKINDKLLDKAKRLDETLKSFLRTALRIVLWIIAAVTVAGTLGIPTGSMIALITIVGAAMSLSVQNILTNLFSGITLLVTRPIAVGEYVEIGSRAGRVRSVGMFYTTIVTLNGQVVTIPNSEVAGTSIVNYGRDGRRRAELTYDASYDDATEDVLAALREAVAAETRFFAVPEPEIFIHSYQSSAVRYGVNAWCVTSDYLPAVRNLNALVREKFAGHGVRMTYDHLNVHMVD